MLAESSNRDLWRLEIVSGRLPVKVLKSLNIFLSVTKHGFVLLQLKLQKAHRYTKGSNYKIQYRAIFKAVILQWLGGLLIKLVV